MELTTFQKAGKILFLLALCIVFIGATLIGFQMRMNETFFHAFAVSLIFICVAIGINLPGFIFPKRFTDYQSLSYYADGSLFMYHNNIPHPSKTQSRLFWVSDPLHPKRTLLIEVGEYSFEMTGVDEGCIFVKQDGKLRVKYANKDDMYEDCQLVSYANHQKEQAF